ncbi:MAG: sulfatase [Planctomycetota bacterium]
MLASHRLLLLAAVPLLAQCGGKAEVVPTPPPAPVRARPALFDRPVAQALRVEPEEDSVLGILESAEMALFREEGMPPWDYREVPFPSGEGGTKTLWHAPATLPIAPGVTWGMSQRRKNWAARKSPPKLADLKPGEFLVDERGIHFVGRKDQKPTVTRPVYETLSTAISTRIAPPLPEPGETLVVWEIEMKGTARRAIPVAAGTDLAWTLSKRDARSRLRFAYGLQAFTATRDDQMVGFVPEALVGATFSLVAQSEEGEVELWSDELGSAEAGVAHAVELNLGGRDLGRSPTLHFRTARAAGSSEHSPHPVWFEPMIRPAKVEEERPNVLLIVLDTLRADRLGCYGYDRPTSPFLDAYAATGVLYEQAWSSAPWTLPSHVSLFTSTYGSEHGAFDGDARLPSEAETVAEVMLDAGYDTAAFTESGYVRADLGLAQGFESFWAHDGDVAGTFAQAKEWIKERRRPYFAFVQTYKVHAPYDPEGQPREKLVRDYDGSLPREVRLSAVPAIRRGKRVAPKDRKYISDLYDAEIRELDIELNMFLQSLDRAGFLDSTLVVITSDHGEEFGEHGEFGHANGLYESLLGVPLILRMPGKFEGGQRVRRPVLGIDVAPTILHAVDLPIPTTWSGRALQEESKLDERPLWVPYRPQESDVMTFAAMRGDLKLIRYPADLRPLDAAGGTALFDLDEDPAETTDLWPDVPDDHERWKRTLESLQGAFPRVYDRETNSTSARVRAQLRQLGYALDDE